MRTSNMKVEKVGFLLERLAKDCAPLQYLRELTENSIEGIEKLGQGQEGHIQWDVDEYNFDETGIQKLRLVDTGIGMSGDQMVQHINSLSSSGGLQTLNNNYGLGAKISAATRNKFGVIYMSWQSNDDPGAMVWLWCDPDTGEYGLKRFEVDGEYLEVVPPDEAHKPALIKAAGHGTVVILLGDDEDQNTFAPKDSSTEWIAQYLEGRYFEFPENVTLRARDSKEYVRTAKHGSMRPVYGRKFALADISKKSGRVELFDGSIARWWILDKNATVHSTRLFKGYAAALYQSELYESTTGNSSRLRLQNFGCTFSHRDVVIYVEPKASKALTTNTARTVLLVNGEPLPWDTWADDFREKMPQELKDLEEAYAIESVSGNSEAMMDRLKKILSFFNLSRFRPVTKDGTHEIISEMDMGGGHGGDDDGGEWPGHPRIPGDKHGKLKFGVAAKIGVTAIEVASKQIPEVRWVPPPDLDESLIDRAANYARRENIIFANSTFAAFTDMVGYWKNQYANVPGSEAKIVDVVHEAFAQQLIETILGLQSLKNRRYWTEQQVDDAWSEEALTAAVMPRSQVLLFVGKALKTALGNKAEGASV